MDKYTILACLLVTVAFVSFADGACDTSTFQACTTSTECAKIKTYLDCLGKAVDACDNDTLKKTWKATLDAAQKAFDDNKKCAGERAMPAALLVGLLAFLVNRLF